MYKESNNDDLKNFAPNLLKTFAIIFLGLGLLLFITVLIPILFFQRIPLNPKNITELSYVTSGIIGTLFTIGGTFLLYLNLRKQNDSFQIERFENRYFELIRIYRDNVKDIETILPDNERGYKIHGREVFMEINRQFILITQRLKAWEFEKFTEIDVLSLPQIAYLIVFFGFSNSGSIMLKYHLDKLKIDEKYPGLKGFIFDDSELGVKKSAYSNVFAFYNGHQISLGHYFRHLFSTINYVHRNDVLTSRQKYEYVKILRTQMSTYEQAVFFYNSFSPMGYIWELSKRDIEYNFKFKEDGDQYRDEDLLITRYGLIKNIPEGFTGSLNPKHFYKKLIFEGEEINVG